ncbi:MAG: putative two-component system response regulator [Neptuniibacter pectenicola]|jgi:putative two-component system response regulator
MRSDGLTVNNKKTLLLVDDEPTNLRVLKRLLEDDYRLIYAKNGEVAIKLAREHNPDLILMDVMMPEMTGIEACRHLKLDKQTHYIPIIFVTALKDEIDETAGFEAGGGGLYYQTYFPSDC